MEQAAEDLGREPDLVFLHNPEHALREAAPHNKDLLAQACTALDTAAAKGLCAAWGDGEVWGMSPFGSNTRRRSEPPITSRGSTLSPWVPMNPSTWASSSAPWSARSRNGPSRSTGVSFEAAPAVSSPGVP
jgi:hypothetical protein